MNRFRAPLVALLALAPAVDAQELDRDPCPVVTVVEVGCGGVSGERPVLALVAPEEGLPRRSLQVTRAGTRGDVWVLAGAARAVHGSCELALVPAVVVGPLAVDAAGRSEVEIPLGAALAGLALRVQAVEVDAASPARIATSDALDVGFAAGCITNAELVATLLASRSDARTSGTAYRALYDRGPSTIPDVAAALAPLPPVAQDSRPLAGVVPHAPQSSYLELHVPRALALCYLLESHRIGSLTPWFAPRLVPFRGRSLDPDAAVAAYLRWAGALADFTPATVRASRSPLNDLPASWYGSPARADSPTPRPGR